MPIISARENTIYKLQVWRNFPPCCWDLESWNFGAESYHLFKLVLSLVPGQYLLVSGGDDSALYAAECSLMPDDNDVTQVHVTREVSEASAHTSSLTGNSRQAKVFLL